MIKLLKNFPQNFFTPHPNMAFYSRAQLRSFTGEQQEIWRHQSRRDGAVQETRPGDKLVSLTGELGREEEASGQAQQPGRRPGSMDLPLPEHQAKPHTHS